MPGVGWTRLTQDAVVLNGPGFLCGLVLLTSVTGGDVTVYDGLDSGSGRQVGRFEGEADVSKPILFPFPLSMDIGIFVDVGSNVTEILVAWLPKPLSPPPEPTPSELG